MAGLFNRGWLCCIMGLTGLFNGGDMAVYWGGGVVTGLFNGVSLGR